MKTEYYKDRSVKLEKSLNKYLNKIEKPLIRRYGKTRANDIIAQAKNHYLSYLITSNLPILESINANVNQTQKDLANH